MARNNVASDLEPYSLTMRRHILIDHNFIWAYRHITFAYAPKDHNLNLSLTPDRTFDFDSTFTESNIKLHCPR